MSSVKSTLFLDSDSSLTGSSGRGSYIRLELRTNEVTRKKWREMFAPLISEVRINFPSIFDNRGFFLLQDHKRVFDVFHEVLNEPVVNLRAPQKEVKLDALIVFLFKNNLKTGQGIRESDPDFVVSHVLGH